MTVNHQSMIHFNFANSTNNEVAKLNLKIKKMFKQLIKKVAKKFVKKRGDQQYILKK